MQGIWIAKRIEQFRRVPLGVDDGERTRFRPHPIRDVRPLVRLVGLREVVLDALERREVFGMAGYDLAGLDVPEPFDKVEGGLRSRREHDTGTVVLGGLPQAVEDGGEQACRQRLSLVQDDDAARETVQLLGLAPAIREEALEQLDRRGHDDWRIPVLGGEALPDGIWGGAPVIARTAGALHASRVVLKHDAPRVVGAVFEDAPVHPGGLLRDGREGTATMTASIPCSTTVRRRTPSAERVLPAGRDRQPEDA